MSEKNKTQTLTEQLQEEQMFPNRVSMEKAQLMAEDVKRHVDERHEARLARENAKGFRNILKRSDLKTREKAQDWYIRNIEDSVVGSLMAIEARQSSYLCQRFYNYVGERARQLGMDRLAEELGYEQTHTPMEVYEHLKGLWDADYELPTEQLDKFYQERTMRDVMMTSANVLVSSKESIMKVCELSTGGGFGEFNPLVRATAGFGAQGETHADLSDVYMLTKLLGIGDTSDLPKSLPEMNNFGMTFPVLASALSKHKAFNMPKYKDSDYRLNYEFRYRSEKMRSSGEDVVYIPDELFVYISKSPERSGGGGHREVASELGELAAAASEA